MAVRMAETKTIQISGVNENEVAEKAKEVAAEESAKNPNASVNIKEGCRNCGGGFMIPEYHVIITY